MLFMLPGMKNQCVNWDYIQEWKKDNAVLLTDDQEMSQDVTDSKEKEI